MPATACRAPYRRSVTESVAAAVPPSPARQGPLYRIVRGILRPLVRLVYRPTITGAEHVPKHGPVILASNHLSFVDNIVIPLASPRPVLVDFTATWCMPCKALAPVLEKLAAETRGTLDVVAVDGDDAPAISNRYKVRAFPTVVAFVGGREVGRVVGLTSKEKLLALFETSGGITASGARASVG